MVGAFFAIPYLALSVELLPSIAIGACAFGAGELLLHDKKKDDENDEKSKLTDMIQDAKNKNKQILNMVPKIESENLKNNIKEIYETANKIIETIEKNPKKCKNANNFFDYYLPVTLNILTKYDEIENQKLSSKEGQKFMNNTESMIEKINTAFKTQLSNLYQSDIVDTDAEIKVFEAMLKSDGYDTESEFKKEEKEG